MKHDTNIASQDQADHDKGLEIIRVLQLRRKRDNGRVETTHGDKNPCGLARTLRALADDGELRAAARAVVDAWEGGDLAAAVRNLDKLTRTK